MVRFHLFSRFYVIQTFSVFNVIFRKKPNVEAVDNDVDVSLLVCNLQDLQDKHYCIDVKAWKPC